MTQKHIYICFQLVTANCQPVVSLDNQATNGVIHVVSGILNPVEKSLLEIVSKDPELSTLKTCELFVNKLVDVLIQKNGLYMLIVQEL